jgi:hypothetical protein
MNTLTKLVPSELFRGNGEPGPLTQKRLARVRTVYGLMPAVFRRAHLQILLLRCGKCLKEIGWR